MARSNHPVSVGASLTAQDFASEQQGLLNLIDKLQFAQLENVKLPQIVVVGDQSAGKSSVLEAITGTPFPREAGACTRFATEIRLRRSEQADFSVHIIPDRSRPLVEQERLNAFGGTVSQDTSFEELMNRAVDLIAPKRIPGRFATKDVLVVEKQGPNMPLLTLVDLPGLVKNANNDQSVDDIKAINDLTDRYMKSSRTIILAVVGGNQDYVQAPVLNKAREFDPSGGRTIGVLTKPDLTESIGLEDKFIALINNNDKHNDFKLGWYVLLNPGPRESGQGWPSQEERKQNEDSFFKRGKWSSLPPSMCGVDALKQKLSVQLQRHIGKHVRTLRREITKALDQCESELKAMGSGKDTVEEMRVELVQLCSESKDLVKPAVDGTYKDPPGKLFFPRGLDKKGTPPQKLRARVVEENKRFASKVRAIGHKLNFTPPPDSAAGKMSRFGNMTKQEFARKEVQPLLLQNTGTEFPTDHNPRLVYTLFQDYSEKWARLAQEHRDNLGIVCNEFLAEVIDEIWPKRMREPLRTQFLDPQMKAMLKDAQMEVTDLQNDQHFEIQPYDPEYEERLEAWRVSVSDNDPPHTVAEEVLEKMLIYYDLSAKVFIRNVITQVVERHLLQGLHSVFSTVKVCQMKEKEIEDIASEDKITRERRLALKSKKRAIEDARDICAGLAMRKELRAYDDEEGDNSDDSSEDEEEGVKTSQQAGRSHIPASSINEEPKVRRKPQESQPANFEDTLDNGGSSQDRNSGPSYPESRPTRNQSQRSEAEVPRTPGGWYTPVTNTPQYMPAAPPPPPRPSKEPALEELYRPLTPPDSARKARFTAQEEGHVQENGHRYPKTYLDGDSLDYSRNGNGVIPEKVDAHASYPKKQPRKFFGKS